MADERARENPGAAKKICAAPPVEPALPAVDCPVLIGPDAIAAWLGISRGRCRGMITDATLPTFRLPGRSVRCALKSAIAEAFAEYARREAARKSAG